MPTSLRIVSANLLNGRADANGFADLVTRVDADVVAVQEIAPPQAEALAAAFPHGLVEGRDDMTGMGIALRRPGHVRRLPLAARGAYAVTLDPVRWPHLATPIEIINVHIIAPHTRPLWRTARDRRTQMLQLEAYLDASAQPSTVVVGDFNSTPRWPLYRRLARRLTDAAVAVAEERGHRPHRTWAPWPGGPRLLRIDHGLVQGVHVSDFQVLHVDGTDHWAIVIDVATSG